MDDKKDILIVGVGGQGIILASEILADAGKEAGYDVKKSEVHGMSQRGGSVSTHVRFGTHVYSPLIKEGDAGYLLGFELLEALRWVHFIHPEGIIIVNNLRINPTTVSSGLMEYPANINDSLQQCGHRIQFIEGIRMAEQAGSKRAMNVVLLGTLSQYLPEISEEVWLKIIGERVPPKTEEINVRAFFSGRAQK